MMRGGPTRSQSWWRGTGGLGKGLGRLEGKEVRPGCCAGWVCGAEPHRVLRSWSQAPHQVSEVHAGSGDGAGPGRMLSRQQQGKGLRDRVSRSSLCSLHRHRQGTGRPECHSQPPVCWSPDFEQGLENCRFLLPLLRVC